MAVSRFSKNIADAAARVADMSENPIPEGYTSLTPFLVIDGAAGAIEFYTSVFGATLIEKMEASDDLIAHAELDFGDGRLQLSDPNPDYKLEAPERKDSVTHFDGVVLPRCRRRRCPRREGGRHHPRGTADVRHR